MLAVADSPPTTFAPFRGPQTTIDAMREGILGPRGERSMLLRSMTEHCVRGIQPKDYLSEILAVRNFVAEHVKYVNDPLALELVKDPQRLAEEINAHGTAIGDCDDSCSMICAMCRQLGREVQIVTVGFGAPNHFSHVFPRVKEPKSGSWIVTDTVAGTREAQMLARVKTYRIWLLD